jgi:DNA-binding CsgD family transcriptional regulator
MSRALVTGDGPIISPLHTQLWNELRLDDAYALYAPNGATEGFGMGIGLPRGHYGVHDSRDWSKVDAKFGAVARHIEQSLALRRSLKTGQGVVASFDESGRGEYDSQTALQKEDLLRLAKHQERSRDALAAGDHGGLQRWRQLLDGGWSIIRQQGSGGRLRFLVVRNPTADPLRRLTADERLVVDLAALGLANKEIAFERNCPESTVANLLTRAMRRMGVANRVHLVLLARSLGVHRASQPK